MADGLLNKASIILTPTGYKAGTLYNVAPVVEPYEDFDFARASVASRVNSSGLVEMVGRTLGSELVTNGDFSELGSELVTNGDFATDSDWTLGTSWSIGDGKATSDGGASYLTSSSSFRWTVGKTYKVSLEITEYNSGSVSLPFDGIGANTNYQNSSGVKTAYIVAGANNPIYIYSSGFNGSIDNVSVKQVDPNDYWSTTGSWGIVNNQAEATANSTSQYLQQNFSITNGNVYKFSYEIIENTLNGNGASLSSSGGFGSVSLSNVVGTHTEYITASNDSATYALKIGVSGTATSGAISIDNVSVKEVIDTNNIPRISYDSNGDNGHILLEPSRINYATYSSDINEWNEVISNGTITSTSNYALAPNGENEATRLQLNSTTGYALKSASTTSFNDDYYISIYLKSNTTGNQEVTIYGRNSSTISYTVTPQWQRFTVACNNSSGSAFFNFGVFSSFGSDTDLDILAWGGQLEQGSYSTSYIPTLTGSPETRATETATGAGSADLINSTEGVLYAEIAALVDDLSFRTISLSDGTTSNRCVLRYGGTTNRVNVLISSGGSIIFDNNFTLTEITNFNKIAVKWKLNDFALWVDGVERATDTSGAAPIGLSQLQLSNYNSSSNNFYGKCKALAVFNEALSDAELTQLTT